jgi:hypothetical protein
LADCNKLERIQVKRIKGKDIPVIGRGGPQGYERLKLSILLLSVYILMRVLNKSLSKSLTEIFFYFDNSG